MNLDYLARHPIFNGIDRSDLTKVAGLLEEEDYKKGSAIIKEGEQTKGIYFIVAGSAVVRKKLRHADGFQDLVTLGPGATFGELEFLDLLPAAASVVAGDHVSLYFLANPKLYSIKTWSQETFTSLVLNLAREISSKLRHMDEGVGD